MSERTIEHEFLQGALFEVLNAFAGERTRAFMTAGNPLRHHLLLYSNEGTVSLTANGRCAEAVLEGVRQGMKRAKKVSLAETTEKVLTH